MGLSPTKPAVMEFNEYAEALLEIRRLVSFCAFVLFFGLPSISVRQPGYDLAPYW